MLLLQIFELSPIQLTLMASFANMTQTQAYGSAHVTVFPHEVMALSINQDIANHKTSMVGFLDLLAPIQVYSMSSLHVRTRTTRSP